MRQIIVFIVLILYCGCQMNSEAKEANKTSDSQLQWRVDHVAINVRDLDRSVAFYTKVFELVPLENGTGLSNIRWFRLGHDQELHIIAVDHLEKQIPKGVHFALAVSDFERFRENLSLHDLMYYDWPGAERSISLRPDGVRQLYLQDPDGYWIEINDAYQELKD